MLEGKRAELANLYLDSGSVRFGGFKLAAHETDPQAELTPLYLHFPETDDSGQLVRMFELIGELFCELLEVAPLVPFNKITGIPSGANPLAIALANKLDRLDDVVEFEKKTINDRRVFIGPTKGWFGANDTLLVVDDHVSGGYTKVLFMAAMLKLGFRIDTMLVVVDRQQGAKEALENRGVQLRSIFGLDELLDYYASSNRIDGLIVDRVKDYISRNKQTVLPV